MVANRVNGPDSGRARPRVLFVGLEMPSPKGGGTLIRNFNLLRHLHETYRFTYLCVDAGRPDGRLETLQGMCEAVHTVSPLRRSGRSKWGDRVRRLAAMAGPKPLHVRNYYPPELRRKARALLAASTFDILHVDHPEMSEVLLDASPVGRTRRVLGHDIISPKLASYLAVSTSRKDALYRRIDLRKFRRFEGRAIEACDLFIVCSPQDREVIRAVHGDTETAVVPNGVDLDYFRREGDAVGPEGAVLFVGSLGILPNVDGLLYFHREVLPRIRREIPRAHLTIVGRDPSPELLALQGPDVTVTGWVDDVRPYYEKARVVIAPVRCGGGTSLKIPEAFAMGRPVVSTAFGARGFAVEDGRHLLIADEPAPMAEAVVKLLRDDTLCEAVGKAGRMWCRETLGWDAIARMLDEAYRRVLEIGGKSDQVRSGRTLRR